MTAKAWAFACTKAVKITLGCHVFPACYQGEALSGGISSVQAFLQCRLNFGGVGQGMSLYHLFLPAVAVSDLVLKRLLEALGGDEFDTGKVHVLALDLGRVGIVTVESEFGSERADGGLHP